jgi:hypothetical protein
VEVCDALPPLVSEDELEVVSDDEVIPLELELEALPEDEAVAELEVELPEDAGEEPGFGVVDANPEVLVVLPVADDADSEDELDALEPEVDAVDDDELLVLELLPAPEVDDDDASPLEVEFDCVELAGELEDAEVDEAPAELPDADKLSKHVVSTGPVAEVPLTPDDAGELVIGED